jgi:hypothetical protein
MNPKLQLPNDPLTQHQRQQAAQQAYVQQFVNETARELFDSRCPAIADGTNDAEVRTAAQQSVRAARIFAEEALGIRFEGGET